MWPKHLVCPVIIYYVRICSEARPCQVWQHSNEPQQCHRLSMSVGRQFRMGRGGTCTLDWGQCPATCAMHWCFQTTQSSGGGGVRGDFQSFNYRGRRASGTPLVPSLCCHFIWCYLWLYHLRETLPYMYVYIYMYSIAFCKQVWIMSTGLDDIREDVTYKWAVTTGACTVPSQKHFHLAFRCMAQ